MNVESEGALKKSKLISNVIGRVLGVLLLVLAIFLAITAMTFSFGGGKNAPDIFGFNIYIVKGGDFYQLKNGTAAMAEKVWPDEVYPGEIIIYRLSEKDPYALARVNNATIKEAVMSYEVETENHETITLSQGQYIAKVTHCSDFLGGLINYATSPFGLMTIAILPCLAIAVFELVKFIISKLPAPEVETIRIQEETPTFVPKKEIEQLSAKREQEKQEKKELAHQQKIFTAKQTDANQNSPGKTDEFTERLRRSDRIKASPQKPVSSAPVSPITEAEANAIKDRPDFSSAAKKRMESDFRKAEAQKQTDERKQKIFAASDDDKTVSDEKFASGHKAADRETALRLNIPDTKAPEKISDVPDMSLVFSDDEDEKYNIDDILAEIARKKK